MTDRAVKIRAHRVLSQNQDLLRVVVKCGSSHLQLSGERGGAQGGVGEREGDDVSPSALYREWLGS